ncbi:rhomboid-domain-containing protein [Basidiobolus meristosporus CBS 931.73]|uniref:Rhomboid-type serine protease n=1 Tax=Basidiobolus meristosporus CBS 931.73 TaxID=1314790 RepID=A0A1Y1YRX2_9FUNG|nr:rhomboid-domain-containing protein [Basidiobolus meristosporus CBS 931.73]|eukprot:ORY00783.1 rhomboid-domain-containing protein [Basidiobolus meristosporus CBS 931.73]
MLDSKQARIQKQLAERKRWSPWFIRTVSLAQLALVIYSLFRNSQLTGSWIQTQPYFNWLIGPSPETLINIGARFVPCMRSTNVLFQSVVWSGGMDYSLEYLCGFGGYKGAHPNQWFRFIVPVFLHGGVLHYLLNMTVQLTTGAQMEREIGPFRMASLYMVSGVGGFIFGALFAPPDLPSVGASGALFGLIGCQLVNLLLHWTLFASPCRELIKMVLVLLINFAIGLLPSIDNFAHIGGFVCGVFAGLALLPTIHTSSTDKWIKRILRALGLVVVVVLYSVGLKYFYAGVNPNTYCPWCKYFSCLPFNGWCNGIQTY